MPEDLTGSLRWEGASSAISGWTPCNAWPALALWSPRVYVAGAARFRFRIAPGSSRGPDIVPAIFQKTSGLVIGCCSGSICFYLAGISSNTLQLALGSSTDNQNFVSSFQTVSFKHELLLSPSESAESPRKRGGEGKESGTSYRPLLISPVLPTASSATVASSPP